MPQESTADPMPRPADEPRPGNRREQFGWYFYDWANSAFSSTVGAVFLGPYVSNLTQLAAGPDGLARFFGIPVAPDSFLPYCVALSVVLQVLFLPILGAIADYSNLRKKFMQLFAISGGCRHNGHVLCHARDLVVGRSTAYRRQSLLWRGHRLLQRFLAGHRRAG